MAKTPDELRKQLADLNKEIEAWDQFTDKHPYPSGMNKLSRLWSDRRHLLGRLAEAEHHENAGAP